MAILANEKVLTLDYWKPARLIEVGDYVFNQTGDLVKVTLVQQYHAANCYRAVFSDHLSVSGDSHLSFPIETEKYRKRLGEYKGVFKFRRPLKYLDVEYLKDYPLTGTAQRLALSVPTAHPLKLPTQTLPIPPFVFGFWFYNRGAGNKMIFSKGNSEYITERFKDHGYQITLGKKEKSGERYFTTTPAIESQLAGNMPLKIPNNYLLASEEQRLDLLRGILLAKSRQYNKSRDHFRISSKRLQDLSQIQCLIESLGHKTVIEHNSRHNYYTLFFKSRINLVPNQVSPPLRVQYGRRFCRFIEEISPQACVYIETNGEANPILVGEGFIPCH